MINKNLINILDRDMVILIKILNRMQEVGIENSRQSQVAGALLELGLDKEDESIQRVLLVSEQRTEKNEILGMSEAINCLKLFSFYEKDFKTSVTELTNIIVDCSNNDGGLGRFNGDRSRIPICWSLLESFHYLNKENDNNIKRIINWMEKEWSNDMTFGGLSYKCAGILIAAKYYPFFNNKFIERSLNWLMNDQSDDGGWSAKKGFSVGSVPSFTGLALRALMNYEKSDKVENAISHGINWLIATRHKGLWKEHPIERSLIQIDLFVFNQVSLCYSNKDF
jgi:prenyltransferase beta subunit